MKKYSLLLLIFLLLFAICKPKSKDGKSTNVVDFDEIVAKGELTIITLNSSTSYFLYKDEPMGYDYDMAQSFCRQHGLKLNVKVAENSNRLVEMLNDGEGDLIAYALVVQNELKDQVIYCGIEGVTNQVLVQRNTRKDTLVKDVSQLIGQSIHVKYGSKFHQRLKNLNSEIGGGINIIDVDIDTINSEELISKVANGEIKYTVTDEHIAQLNHTYFDNINVSLPISYDQRAAWAVRKESPKLAKELNDWVEANSDNQVYKSIIKKYFEKSKQEFEDDLEIARHLDKRAISVYDELFKKHATGSKYDWHFLAAISYQESRFKNNLTSWAGASGIMGLMLATAQSLGLSDDDRMNPDLSIGATVRFLDRLDKIYADIEDRDERLKFMLAAYNGGMGHVNDGRKLAKKYGYDPNIWDKNVQESIKLKRYPEYYNDPVCKSGYFRGTETLRYVYDVTLNTKRFAERTKKMPQK